MIQNKRTSVANGKKIALRPGAAGLELALNPERRIGKFKRACTVLAHHTGVYVVYAARGIVQPARENQCAIAQSHGRVFTRACIKRSREVELRHRVCIVLKINKKRCILYRLDCILAGRYGLVGPVSSSRPKRVPATASPGALSRSGDIHKAQNRHEEITYTFRPPPGLCKDKSFANVFTIIFALFFMFLPLLVVKNHTSPCKSLEIFYHLEPEYSMANICARQSLSKTA